jgi:hypothetical protein
MPPLSDSAMAHAAWFSASRLWQWVVLICGLLGAPARLSQNSDLLPAQPGAPPSRRQEAARSRILNIQKQIRHMIRDYSLLVLLRRRDAGAPAWKAGAEIAELHEGKSEF